MAEVIVGVLGAGILGMLGFFYSSIKSDFRALGTRLDRSETILINLLERLTRMETVQEEHGRLLADHGRRLTTIETTLADHGRRLTTIETTLAEHGRRLTTIETTLEEHGRLLAQMTDHGERIAALEGRVGAG